MKYKLNMSYEMYNILKRIAHKKNVAVSELFRRAVQWVVLERELENTGGEILIDKGYGERVRVLPY
ncbi:hypothetical protein LCGC14_0593210 [marine sediment metagenome]|uniref:Uncharacterized protein n=1 Tax=marine sediment metagenome TaxID=412755 RepID=A0A0F9UL97_9ZZZZ